MYVRSIYAYGVMNYNEDPDFGNRVDIPQRGILLLSGLNGSGKSGVIESISVAGWGKSLRGKSIWRDGIEGSVSMVYNAIASNGTVERTRSKSGTMKLGGSYANFETPTKAQARLEEDIGSWEMWRARCVFDSDDAERFTSATDAERKRFLEQLTDPEGTLDAALVLCRKDVKREEDALSEAEEQQRLLDERARGLSSQRADAKAALAEATAARTAEDPSERIEALKAERAALRERSVTASELLQRYRNRMAALGAEAHAAAAEVARLKGNECGQCGQPIDPKRRKTAEKKAASVQAEQEKERATLKAAIDEGAKELEVVTEKIDTLTEQIADLRVVQEEYEREVESASKIRDTIKRLGAQLEDLEEDQEKRRAAIKAHQRELATLIIVEKCLGTRGLRSFYLQDLLTHIEQSANTWLVKLAGEHEQMEIKLKPYTEKQKGGLSDVISLEINCGGGHYGGSSRGERRRVDIAMMLALADLNAKHRFMSTLFFDEVFDALDEPGLEAAADVIRGLAANRAVVVISHNEQLVKYLEDVTHYTAEDGMIRRAR